MGVHAQNTQVNQFYNVTLIISEGDKIIQDSISHSQSVSNRYRILREAVYANETLQWDIESFDVMQKYLFDEIDATFEFITEQTELMVDFIGLVGLSKPSSKITSKKRLIFVIRVTLHLA